MQLKKNFPSDLSSISLVPLVCPLPTKDLNPPVDIIYYMCFNLRVAIFISINTDFAFHILDENVKFNFLQIETANQMKADIFLHGNMK